MKSNSKGTRTAPSVAPGRNLDQPLEDVRAYLGSHADEHLRKGHRTLSQELDYTDLERNRAGGIGAGDTRLPKPKLAKIPEKG